MTYTKLFSSITASTLWGEPYHVRIVFVTMLAMKDRDGVVEASIPGLARIANVTVDEARDAIDALLSPDPDSRTPDHGGRRIDAVDGGWLVLNHDLYHDKDSSEDRNQRNAEKQRRYRDRQREQEQRNALRNAGNALPSVTYRYGALPSVTQSDQIRSDQNKKKKSPPGKPESSSSTPLLASLVAKKYLEIFNAVFRRNVGARTIIEDKIAHRLKSGVKDWQILCAPLLQLALDPSTPKVRNFSPEMLLRDGKHARTSENGATHGATDWIERIYMNADKAVLDEHLTEIAAHFELTEWIRKTGAQLSEPVGI